MTSKITILNTVTNEQETREFDNINTLMDWVHSLPRETKVVSLGKEKQDEGNKNVNA